MTAEESFWLCGPLNAGKAALRNSPKLGDRISAAMEGFALFPDHERIVVARCEMRKGQLVTLETYEVPREKAVRFIPYPDMSHMGL